MKHRSKLIKAGLVLAIAAGCLASVDTAQAGGWHHHRGGARVGVWIGGPVWWPGYYPYRYGWYPYPSYAYPYPYGYAYAYPYPYSGAGYPPVAQSVPPSVQTVPQPAAQWYYCPDSRMFYPHVSECASGWQAVPAAPPDTRR